MTYAILVLGAIGCIWLSVRTSQQSSRAVRLEEYGAAFTLLTVSGILAGAAGGCILSIIYQAAR